MTYTPTLPEDLTVTESYDETTDDDEAEISEDEAELEA